MYKKILILIILWILTVYECIEFGCALQFELNRKTFISYQSNMEALTSKTKYLQQRVLELEDELNNTDK